MCSSSGWRGRARTACPSCTTQPRLCPPTPCNHTTAIVTDGRYSGAMKGPCIGHVAPEAIDGGPIALVADGDLIEINAPERRLAIVGVNGEHRSPDEIEA